MLKPRRIDSLFAHGTIFFPETQTRRVSCAFRMNYVNEQISMRPDRSNSTISCLGKIRLLPILLFNYFVQGLQSAAMRGRHRGHALSRSSAQNWMDCCRKLMNRPYGL